MQEQYLLERSFDGVEHFGSVGFGLWLEACEDFAVFADQELAEVPFDVTWEWRVRAAQGLVEGVFVLSFDDDFVEQGEGDVVFAGTEFLDVFVAAGFLAAEVVAGEGEDGEAVFGEGFVEGLQFRVLFGVAAFRGDVDDEHDFALVRFEGGVVAFDVLDGDVVEATGGEVGGAGDESAEGEKCFHGQV